MYEEPKLEILLYLKGDVLNSSFSGWEDWEDENADPDGWVQYLGSCQIRGLENQLFSAQEPIKKI